METYSLQFLTLLYIPDRFEEKRSLSGSWPLHADNDIGAKFCLISYIAVEVNHNQVFLISFRLFHAFLALLLILHCFDEIPEKRVENLYYFSRH